MSAPLPSAGPLFRPLLAVQEDLKALKAGWYWFLILGIALIVLGTIAVAFSAPASEAAMFILGFFLVAGGFFYIIGAFFTRCWGGFFLSLLAGVLHLAVGVIFIEHPVDAAIVFTLLLAAFFFVEGLFRIVGALTGQFHNWGWALCSGVLTLLLGVIIWRQWPFSGAWVPGTLIGIDMIFSGATYVAIGMSARSLPVPQQ
jgi:uncharacterized membrane protein HdeD (DUF308 family)